MRHVTVYVASTELADQFRADGVAFGGVIEDMAARGLPGEFWFSDVLDEIDEDGLAFLKALVAAAEKAQAEEGGAS